jgi:hypothetical protein
VQFRDTNHRDRDPEPYPYTVRLKAVPK